MEFAYARHWLANPHANCSFSARTPWGGFALIPRGWAARLLDALGGVMAGRPGARRAARLWAAALRARLATGAGRSALLRGIRERPGGAFLLVSHMSLERAGPIRTLKQAGAAFVPMIHDLIPISHPEFSRAAQTRAHLARMAVTAELADHVLVNSDATCAALTHHLRAQGRRLPPITSAPLGLDLPPAVGSASSPRRDAPYFVMLGTIEPRKNHLMILSLWRELAETIGPGAPRLVLVGRRGWNNEQVFRMLDGRAGFCDLVEERGPLGDAEIASVLAGARALLFPSFAEGYGIPLIEALSLGVPAICSDAPALIEVGAGVPEHLPPLDGAAWRRAVLDYASDESPARVAQLERLKGWRRPEWVDHFATIEGLLAKLAAEPHGRAHAAADPLIAPARQLSSVAGAR